MRQLKDVINLVEETLTTKGNQYGPTYRRVATMLSVQPQYSILVRILEKTARIHNLLQQSGGIAHLREEFIDIACYAILAAFESEDGTAGSLHSTKDNQSIQKAPKDWKNPALGGVK